MSRPLRRILGTTILLAGVFTLQACVPIFSDGQFQTLRLLFKLDKAVANGEKKDFQTLVFSEAVKVKKNWVQISGRLDAPAGSNLAGKIKVEAQLERLDNGRATQKIAITLNVDNNGFFTGKKAIKKNIGSGEMMSVTLQPTGGTIPKNTEITLCVDLVKKKAELNNLPVCVEDSGDGGDNGAQVSFASIQSSIFTPTCAVSGCHNASSSQAGLVLASGQAFGNLVNVASTQRSSLNRVTPNDPEASYLVKKLRGDSDISGSRMPLGGTALTSAQLNSIIQWIQSGAPNN
jgi:hypothetical protein